MMFLDLIEYGGSTWTAFLRNIPDGGFQLVFRARTAQSALRGCICLLPPHVIRALQEAGPERSFLLEEILATELDAMDARYGEDDEALFR